MNASDSAVVKTCTCGKRHPLERWKQLQLVGPQLFPHGEAFEMRNCTCGSTLAWPIDFPRAVAGQVAYLAVDFQFSEAA